MNEYKITIDTGERKYALTRNADTKAEALQLVLQDFDYSSISEYDEALTLTIVVTKI